MEVDLQQEVAQFLAQLLVVAGLYCVDHLAGLLHEVREEGGVGLLGVPGAAEPELGHHCA